MFNEFLTIALGAGWLVSGISHRKVIKDFNEIIAESKDRLQQLNTMYVDLSATAHSLGADNTALHRENKLLDRHVKRLRHAIGVKIIVDTENNVSRALRDMSVAIRELKDEQQKSSEPVIKDELPEGSAYEFLKKMRDDNSWMNDLEVKDQVILKHRRRRLAGQPTNSIGTVTSIRKEDDESGIARMEVRVDSDKEIHSFIKDKSYNYVNRSWILVKKVPVEPPSEVRYSAPPPALKQTPYNEELFVGDKVKLLRENNHETKIGTVSTVNKHDNSVLIDFGSMSATGLKMRLYLQNNGEYKSRKALWKIVAKVKDEKPSIAMAENTSVVLTDYTISVGDILSIKQNGFISKLYKGTVVYMQPNKKSITVILNTTPKKRVIVFKEDASTSIGWSHPNYTIFKK